MSRRVAVGLIEKQSIQAMAVGNESKTAGKETCVMRMCIAASGQSHPLIVEGEDKAYISMGTVWMTAVGHFNGNFIP